MADPEIEENPNSETSKDAQGGAIENIGDVKMIDTEIEKDEMEESPLANDVKVETLTEKPSDPERYMEELPHCENGQVEADVAAVDGHCEQDHDANDSCVDEDNTCLVEATVVDQLGQNADTENGTSDNTNSDPSEKILEEHVKEEKDEELDNGNGSKEEELENRSARIDSSSNTELKEEELNNKETTNKTVEELNEGLMATEIRPYNEVTDELMKPKEDVKTISKSFLLDPDVDIGDEAGTEEDQLEFMKDLETFCKENGFEFKPPKFYGEPLNCLKLWRSVVRLGGYEQVTTCKLWRQVGESFKPPKTCTTVSWTFRLFYEKALLEYEKHKMRCGELPFTDVTVPEPVHAGNQDLVQGQASGEGSGRVRRDAAFRAMQGWHSQRLLGNGEDKTPISVPKREKQLKSIGLLKKKRPSPVEQAVKAARMKTIKPHVETMVVDVGPPADWVKISVQRTKDCFEVYALVPGLLREEVRVQSDPVGRLVISGQPEQLDNPWGVTPFKKIVSLPSRIDPHQTSAVVTLHGQLFVRVPFEQSDI
jgi:HSP20 family molecular chaperone IbpA